MSREVQDGLEAADDAIAKRFAQLRDDDYLVNIYIYIRVNVYTHRYNVSKEVPHYLRWWQEPSLLCDVYWVGLMISVSGWMMAGVDRHGGGGGHVAERGAALPATLTGTTSLPLPMYGLWMYVPRPMYQAPPHSIPSPIFLLCSVA